jgi:serine protease inhibitor
LTFPACCQRRQHLAWPLNLSENVVCDTCRNMLTSWTHQETTVRRRITMLYSSDTHTNKTASTTLSFVLFEGDWKKSFSCLVPLSLS